LGHLLAASVTIAFNMGLVAGKGYYA